MRTKSTSAYRTVPAERSPLLRSAVTNGRKLFVEGDGNSAWSRRYRDLIAGHVNDLGGEDLLSESEKSLIRRASTIELELEGMEGRLSRGEQVDLDAFTRAASHLRRILESLGLQRRSRDVQTLEQYVAANYDRDERPTEAEDSLESEPGSEAALSEKLASGRRRLSAEPSP